jgi:hypothetical protein
MAGALMQLVAYGTQDVYLTVDPTITFWKAIYRRHTNFAMEAMNQTLNGRPDFGNRIYTKISRNGDLLHRCYLKATLPPLDGSLVYVNRVGFRLIKMIELRVGGQVIDRHYSTWMHIWTELTHTSDHKEILDNIVGPKGDNGNTSNSQNINEINVPLLFSFCRNPGLSIPLVALQYHEVELWIDLETLSNCIQGGSDIIKSLTNVQLWADYIFLDTDERKEFVANPHEYLIETTQTFETSVIAGINNVKIQFNHPTKFIVWANRANNIEGDDFTSFCSGPGVNSNINTAKLLLNGMDRFAERDSKYFNYIQPYQHFEIKPDLGINMYSFALKPAEHQPSGSCNFSRIDNINLLVNCTVPGNLHIYGFSYNVFRVSSGMGGLVFAN